MSSGSSTSAFLTTLIIYGIIALVYISVFVCFKKSQTRVYQPRYTVATVPVEKRPDSAPAGAFAWFSNLMSKPENYVIQQAGPDGYFFLRYLFNFFFLSVVGGALIWAVLFPVNATNGYYSAGGADATSGFDIIGFVNVKNKNRYFAHAFMSWIFFGSVVFVIYRELVYYVSFRQALQSTPMYDSLLSSRTVFLTDLPEKYQTEEGIRTLFPAAQNIWFARNHKELEKKVKERTKLSNKYEATMNKVIKKSMKLRAKAIKKNKEVPSPENELTAYIPEKKLPTHKLKPIIGKKVKTLEYAPEHLGELNQEIGDKQASYTTAEKVGSVFLEFPSQLEAQRAYQAVPYAKELKKCQRVINSAPEDIIWENASNSFVTRHLKAILAKTILTLTIIFWAIPVAVVGCISNINYLTSKVPFLKFIDKMPSVLMGVITGLLPTILLAVLMMLLPVFIRKMGRVAGLLTVQQVDFWTQSWYYGFQVVQVFLVTTLASSASSVVTQILDDPTSAMTLLAKYLPRASNFYIPYMLLQGLAIASGALAQVVGLILAQFLGKILDNTPRKQWNRYNNLGKPSWGTTYAVYQLIAVILLCYSIIAPIIIVFAAITFFLIYVAFLYNLTYVLDHTVDARGRSYPKALLQTFVGIYLAEVCLLALFIMAKSWGPVGIEAALIFVTVAAHLYYKWKFIPLLDAIPISVLKGGEGYNQKDQGLKEVKETGKNFWVSDNQLGAIGANGASDGTATAATAATTGGVIGNGANTIAGDSSSANSKERVDSQSYADQNTAINNGTESYVEGHNPHATTTATGYDDEKALIDKEQGYYGAGGNGVGGEAALGGSTIDNNLPTNVNWFKRFFKPTTYLSLPVLQKLLPYVYQQPVSYNKENKSLYVDPAVSDECAQLWIPKDPCGLSTVQIEKAHAHGISVTDENASIDDKANVTQYGPPPDYEEAIKQ